LDGGIKVAHLIIIGKSKMHYISKQPLSIRGNQLQKVREVDSHGDESFPSYSGQSLPWKEQLVWKKFSFLICKYAFEMCSLDGN
jgi:hypothetical protein